MASERDRAKRAITEQVDVEPDFDLALSQGQELRHKYDIAVEQNRSKEQLRAMDLGWVGKFLGGEITASTTAAFIVVCVGLLGFLISLGAASRTSDREFWSKQAERSIALALTALSFIFGKGAGKTSQR